MNKPKLGLATAVLLVSMLAAQPRLGQSAEAESKDSAAEKSRTTAEQPQDQKPEVSNDQVKANAKAKPKGAEKDKDKVFIPSEEISEDFAVSFPVDI